MRAFTLLTVAVVVAIGVGIAVEGATIATGPKAAFSNAVNSLGASPYLEVAMADPGTRASVGVTLDEVSTDGTPIGRSGPSDPLDVDLALTTHGSVLAEIRTVGENAYLRVAPSAIGRASALPSGTRRVLGRLLPLLGGGWLELPAGGGGLSRGGAIAEDLPSAARTAASVHAFDTDLLVAARFSSSPGSHGESVTSASIGVRSLAAILRRDLLPLFDGFAGGAATRLGRLGRALPGTGAIAVRVVTSPNGSAVAVGVFVTGAGAGRARAVLRATIAHRSTVVDAPPRVRALAPLLGGVLGLGTGSPA